MSKISWIKEARERLRNAVSDVDAIRYRGDRERDFIRNVVEQSLSPDPGVAVKTFADNLETLFREVKRVPAEKLYHLYFLSKLLLTNTPGLKYGHQKTLRKFNRIHQVLKKYPQDNKAGFVDFGCGPHDPLAVSSILFLNGFERNFALDYLKPVNQIYSAYSMYDLIGNIMMFPGRYALPGVDIGLLRENCDRFDLAGFEAGDFRGGFASVTEHIHHFHNDILETEIDRGSVNLLYSNAVMEHVQRPEAVIDYIFEILRPGGVAVLGIDFRDHRAYSNPNKFNAWSFLTQEEPVQDLNRIRYSQFIGKFKDAGFEVAEESRISEQVPEQTRSRFVSPFQNLDDIDIDTVWLNCVIQRPH